MQCKCGYLTWRTQSKVVKTINYLHKGCVLIDHSDKLPDYKEKVEAVLADKYTTVCIAIQCFYGSDLNPTCRASFSFMLLTNKIRYKTVNKQVGVLFQPYELLLMIWFCVVLWVTIMHFNILCLTSTCWTMQYHAAMLVALRSNCLDTSQEKMENGNVAFTNCVNALMYALRLFSFGPWYANMIKLQFCKS